ncbi:putative late blight resistance protein homolog R1A-10 [Salvia splendens]|uniref:putative late blight resistance protein homolog R1A-10 n=1 Tax=Salvia splendens TaxID=180675 RepID=UPI001C272E1F|nr:putative late blight resistance protein homolog R1A-10 [Salvia splendens]
MAYAAVVSLKHTIHRLLNSSIASATLQSAHVEVKSLQQVLRKLDDSIWRSKRLNELDEEIREAAQKLEDSLEYYEKDLEMEEMEEVRLEIVSFSENVKRMKEEFIKKLDTPEEDDSTSDFSSIRDFGVEMVGISDEISGIKKKLVGGVRPCDYGIFWIVGRAGSGRTVTARIILEELCVGKDKCVDCGAWVTIGPKYQWKDIILAILRQLGYPSNEIKTGHPVNPDQSMGLGDDEELLVEHLYTRLKDRRYMIVLDDVCDTNIWEYLRRSFPKQDNGSLLLLTTSLEEIALFSNSFHISRMPDFDEHPMWDFLCLVVFGGPFCPPQLEEAGKNIIKNCQGLRLVVIKVLLFLSSTKKTPEYWNNIAADKDNPIFMVADEISEVCRFKDDFNNSVPDDDRRAATFKIVAKMLNFSNHVEGIKLQMFPKRLHPNMEIFSIFGMAGIGKTTLVKKIFDDPLILCHFDHHAWITLGPNYQSEEFLVNILARLCVAVDEMHLREDEKLVKDLCTTLSNKRCLIVLDDLWNKEPLHYLKNLLPNIKGEIFVTTRLFEVAKCGRSDIVYKMPLLDEEESWLLFCRKVFSSDLCPLRLEKIGKKICKHCEGLPLLILTVADLLSRAEISLEFWEEAAEKKNYVFMEAQALMSNVVSPSYNYLPQHLKACFLYMGIFSQNYEIPTSKLVRMWAAEGFLEPNPSQTLKDFAMDCLAELVDKSLVMVCKKGMKVKVKTCRLHSVFWHLSNSEAVRSKSFLTLNVDVHNSVESLEAYRRLCIRNAVLFSLKDLQDSIMSILRVHSLLYTGPRHQYPVPISYTSRFLRVLYALMIRLYEFPVEVVKLTQLTFLALTCNGELPGSISKLQKLQHLTVGRHLSIKSREHSSHLPAEIWNMKELNHLQIEGGRLQNPSSDTILPKLVTLLEVDAQSCTKKVLKKIRNLKKLGIQIELEPDDDNSKSVRCLNRISRLRRLESLKCVVLNPDLPPDAVPPPAPRSMFPSGLKKLSLSGLGYPWKYMSIIGNLENLEVLKLQCYAFQGPGWETNYRDFRNLKYLVIEDTDLVWWKLTVPSFLKLEHISIKHCYNFEELPLNTVSSVKMIEVDDCNSVVMKWAEEMKAKHAWNVYGMPARKNQVTCSWDAGKKFK